MSTDQDTTRIVRSWLRTDEHVSADRILGDVLARLDATPQRRPWAARRIAPMHPYAKFALATAAVLVVAVVGFNVLAQGSPGPGGSTPSPTASVPSLSPSPSPSPADAPVAGALEAGTYRLSEFFHTLRPFVFTVPDGWRRTDNFVGNGEVAADDGVFGGDGVSMATWPVSHIYADSCHWDGTLVRTDTVEDVVAALQAQTGHASTEPTTTTFAGLPATRIEFSLPADTNVSGCDEQLVRLWPDAGPKEQFGLPIDPGQTFTIYVLEVRGAPQLFIAMRNDRSPAADVAALEEVMASIRFQP